MTRLRLLIAILAGMLLCVPLLAIGQYAPQQYPPPNQAPPVPYGQPSDQQYGQPPQQQYGQPSDEQYGQPPQQPYTQPPPQPLSQDQLDGLLAPIALYPDELLTQILMASTYPLEVVEAARFVKANPNLRGQALDDALKDKNWDPSVLSLVPFPQVLDMMNEKLEWTQRLGDAFLADEAAVMRTVQGLRERAQQAGNLQSTEQQRVYVQDRNIIIEPAQPQYVYVPVYNPTIIYGPWWAPAYRPWYWYPPPIWGYPPAPSWWGVTAGFFWGSGWAVHRSYWGWARPNWTRNNVYININVNNNYWASRPIYRDRYPNGTGTWAHAPEHRKGVAYRDAATYNRYRPTNPNAVQTRENYRGNTSPPTTLQGSGAGSPTRSPTTVQPTTQPGTRPTSPAFAQQPGTRAGGSAPVSQQTIRTGSSQPGAGPSGATNQQGTRDARERTYRTPQVQQTYGGTAQGEQTYGGTSQGQRTYGGTPQGQQMYGGTPQTFQTQSRPQVQMESNRGQQSRQQMYQTPDASRGYTRGQPTNQTQGAQGGQGKSQQGNQQGSQGRGEKYQGNPGEGGGKSR